MEPLLQLGPLEGKQDVEHMLRGIGLAQHQISLEQVQSGRGTVALGVVARRHQIHDFPDVSVDSKVGRDGHQHIGAVTRHRQHLFVKDEGARKILCLKPLAGGDQLGEHAAAGRRGAFSGGWHRRRVRLLA